MENTPNPCQKDEATSAEERKALLDQYETDPNKVTVTISGRPAVGKTAVGLILEKALKELGIRVLVAAPEGYDQLEAFHTGRSVNECVHGPVVIHEEYRFTSGVVAGPHAEKSILDFGNRVWDPAKVQVVPTTKSCGDFDGDK